MRRDETMDAEDVQRRIQKISRDLQNLQDSIPQRVPGESYESVKRSRKVIAALGTSLRSLQTAKRAAGKPLATEEGLSPILTRQSLAKLVQQGKTVKEIAEHYGMPESAVHRMMRIFDIKPLTKKSQEVRNGPNSK